MKKPCGNKNIRPSSRLAARMAEFHIAQGDVRWHYPKQSSIYSSLPKEYVQPRRKLSRYNALIIVGFIVDKVKALRTAISWPKNCSRRVSINSFGHGSSNAHAIVEQANPSDCMHHLSFFSSAQDKPYYGRRERCEAVHPGAVCERRRLPTR